MPKSAFLSLQGTLLTLTLRFFVIISIIITVIIIIIIIVIIIAIIAIIFLAIIINIIFNRSAECFIIPLLKTSSIQDF